MSKILLSFSGNKSENDISFSIFPFYEGLINALVRNGNDVSFMIVNEFVQSYKSRSNKLSPRLNQIKLDNYIKNQNFDLIIAFNNALYDGYLQKSDIPYVIWGVDPINVYADKENLKSNQSRYIFAGNCEDDYHNIRDYFRPSQLTVLRFATDIRSEKIEQIYPISFVGSLWKGSEKELLKKGLPSEELKQLIDLLRKDTGLTIDQLKKELHIQHNLLEQTSTFWLLHGIAASDRIAVLSALTDLGLHTFGKSEMWQELADTNLPLACTYNPKDIYDLQSTQDLFNCSKISFNMSHIHAGQAGFSFRVIDSMASNACLVTDYKNGYEYLFGRYVKLPTFEYGNPQEARKICEYMLTHEDERSDVVKCSQKAIDAEYRFEHRFKQLEAIVNIKLFEHKKGSLLQIKAKDFINTNEHNKPVASKPQKSNLWNKLRYKFWKHLDKKLRREGIIQ